MLWWFRWTWPGPPGRSAARSRCRGAGACAEAGLRAGWCCSRGEATGHAHVVEDERASLHGPRSSPRFLQCRGRAPGGAGARGARSAAAVAGCVRGAPAAGVCAAAARALGGRLMALEDVVAAGVRNAFARNPVVDRESIERSLRRANRSVARRRRPDRMDRLARGLHPAQRRAAGRRLDGRRRRPAHAAAGRSRPPTVATCRASTACSRSSASSGAPSARRTTRAD